MSIFGRFRTAFAWGVCLAVFCVFSYARAYDVHVTYVPAKAADAFTAVGEDAGGDGVRLTLTPKSDCAYIPTAAHLTSTAVDPGDSQDADLPVSFQSPQSSYAINSDEPIHADATITVTFGPLYAITPVFVPAAAVASFSNDCPAQASAQGVVKFNVWRKDGCAFTPDFATMAGACVAGSAVSGGVAFSLDQALSAAADVNVFCSPFDAWWSSGAGLLRASWQDASVAAGRSAFRHGEDAFIVSGAAGKMLVRAQYAAADLTNAVGRLGATPVATAYEVAVTGLTGSDATTAPAAFAANTAGDKIYAIVGQKVVRLAATYASDAPRSVTALAYEAGWSFTDTPKAFAVATIGGVDLVYVNLEHAESMGGSMTYSYASVVLDASTGMQSALNLGDAQAKALAVTGVAGGAPHLACVDAAGVVSSMALTTNGLALVSAQGLGSFDPATFWVDAAPDTAFLLAADDEASLFIGGTNTANKLQAMVVEAVPAAVTVRVAMPVANGTNDFALAYGVATNLTIDAPSGYRFSSVKANGTDTDLEGAASYAFATDGRENVSLVFALAYAVESEVLGPSSAITVVLPSSVAVGGTVEGMVSVLDATYAIGGIAVDGVPVPWVSVPNVEGAYSFSGAVNASAKIEIALQSKAAWYATGATPTVLNAFTAAGVHPGDGRSAAIDVPHGLLAFGLSATATDAGLAEFSTAELLDAVAIETVAPTWSENSGGRNGEAWGKSVAALPKYAAWVSCNAVVANMVWINPQGGAWSDGAAKANAAYSVAFSGVPGGADVQLSAVAANAAGDAFYGASGTTLYTFTVSDNGATPATITGLAYANAWNLAAEPGALCVATIGGRELVYCAPAAGGAVQVVDVARGTVSNVGVSGTFSALSVSGVAAGTPHLAVVSGTTVSHWPLSGDGLRALSTSALATRDIASLLGVSPALAGMYFVGLDDEQSAIVGCLVGSSLRVATIAPSANGVAVRGRFFDSDGHEVGEPVTGTVPLPQVDFSQAFDAPSGYLIVGAKQNGVTLGSGNFVDALPSSCAVVTNVTVAAPTYFEILLEKTAAISLDLLGYAYRESGDTVVLVGHPATFTFSAANPDMETPEGTVISSVYVNGKPATTSPGAGGTVVATIDPVQPGLRVVVATTTPRDAPENPWHAYTSRFTSWNETAFSASLPVVPCALDATDEFLLDLFGAGAGGARLSTLAAAERGAAASEAVWTLAHNHALFNGNMRGGAIAKQLDVALIGSSNGAFMVSAPLHFEDGETLSAANTFRVTAVTPAGAATATPTAFAFSADALHLYGGSEAIAGVNKYRVLDGLKSADTNLVLEAHYALGTEGQSCESLVLGTFTHGGTASFLYAIGATDKKIYAIALSDGTVTDTGVVAATPFDAMALSAKTNATPHLTLFKGATGGTDATLVVYAVTPATGALDATPVKSFTGVQLGAFAGYGSVDASESGPCRSLAIADNEASAVLGTAWNASATGTGGAVTRGQRIVLGPISSLSIRYNVTNGAYDDAEEGNETSGEINVDGTATTLAFTKTDGTYALRSVTVNGVPVDATETAAGCTVALDYTQMFDGRIELAVEFQVPAVTVWTLGPVSHVYEETDKMHVFVTNAASEIYGVVSNGFSSAFSGGHARLLVPYDKKDPDSGESVLSGDAFAQEGLTRDVRLVVAARPIEPAADHAWWQNPGVTWSAAAPAGATEAAYHFAADGGYFAYTQNGKAKLAQRTDEGLADVTPNGVSARTDLSGAGVSERLNVALFGTTLPGGPIVSTELVSDTDGNAEAPVSISNDQGLALDQFAFSEDCQTLYAICPSGSTAADREKIYAFAIKNALKKAGTQLLLSASYDFGSAVKSFVCATNASGVAVAYAILANGNLVARALADLSETVVLRSAPIANGANEASLCVSGAGTAKAHVTVSWSSGTAHRIEVLGLSANGLSLVGTDPLATFEDADFACLGITSVSAHPAVWTGAGDGTLYFLHGGVTALSYSPTYTITFDVQNGRACTNGVPVTSPYVVSYRSPCDEINFVGTTDQHYLSAVTTNGVTFAFDELTAMHPTNFVYRGSGADATLSIGFTPAMTASFDFVGGPDMATVVPVEPAETRPYRPGESVSFEVRNVKEGYQLAAVSADGETIPCDPTTGQFTYRFVDHGAIVIAFAKTNAWWTAPAVRNTITNAAWTGTVPSGVGCDPMSCDLAFGRGDASHPGLAHYAGEELYETVDPVRAPDHQTTAKTTDVSHAEPLDVEYAPYAAVSALAGVAVGSPTSAEGELAFYRLDATWPEGCGFAVMAAAVGSSMASMKMMAFSDQKVGATLPALYGYDPVAGKVGRYTYTFADGRLRIADVFEEKAFPQDLSGFTCRTVGGEDILYAASGTHVYAFDFAAGTVTSNRYEFAEPENGADGVVGLQIVGVADGTPHAILLNKPRYTVEEVTTDVQAVDENGEPKYEEIQIDDGNGGTTTSSEPVYVKASVTNWFGGISVFALSNDCRTLIGTHPVYEHHLGKNFLAGSTWGAFGASDDETRAFNVTADGTNRLRLETVEHATDTYYVEAQYVDIFGKTIRRDRSYTFKPGASGAENLYGSYYADDRYAILSVVLNGVPVAADQFTEDRYTYNSGMVTEGMESQTRRVMRYEHIKITEGFKPVVRQQLVGDVTSSQDFETTILSAGSAFDAAYVPNAGFAIASLSTNGVMVDVTALTNELGVLTLSVPAIYDDYDVIVFAKRERDAVEHPWWENPAVAGSTTLGSGSNIGSGIGPAWTDGEFVALPLGVDYPRSRASFVYEFSALEEGGAERVHLFNPADLPFRPHGAAAFAPYNLVLYSSRSENYAVTVPLNGDPLWTNTVDRFANAYVVSNTLNCAFDAAAFSSDGKRLYVNRCSSGAPDQKIVRFNVKRGLKANGVTLTGALEVSTENKGTPVALTVASMPYAGNANRRDVVYYVATNGNVYAVDMEPSGSVGGPEITQIASGMTPANGGARIAVTGLESGTPHLVVASAQEDPKQALLRVYALNAANGYVGVTGELASFDAEKLGWIGLSDPSGAGLGLFASDDDGTVVHVGAQGPAVALTYAAPQVVDWSVRHGSFMLDAGKDAGVRTNYTWQSRNWEFHSESNEHYKLAFVLTNGVRMANAPVGVTSYVHTVKAGLETLEVQFLPALWFTNDNYRVVGGETIGVITNFSTGYLNPGDHVTGKVEVVKAGWELVRVELGGEPVAVGADGRFDAEVTDRNDVQAFFAPAAAWWREPFRRTTLTNVLETSTAIDVPSALDEVGRWYIRGNGGRVGLTAWNLDAVTNAVDPQLAAALHDSTTWSGLTAASAATTIAVNPGQWALTGLSGILASGSAAMRYPLNGGANWPADCDYVTAGALSNVERWSFGSVGGLYGYAGGHVRRYDVAGGTFVANGDPQPFAHGPRFAVATISGKDLLYGMSSTNLVVVDFAAGTAVTNALTLASGFAGLVSVAVTSGDTPSPRALVAYSTWTDSCRLAVVALNEDGKTAASPVPLAEFSLSGFLGTDPNVCALHALNDDTRAFVPLNRNRTVVLEKKPETVFAETCVVDETGAVLVAADRSHAVALGDPLAFALDAPAGRLFTDVLVDGTRDAAFRTASNFTYTTASQTGYTRLTLVAKPAQTIRQTLVGRLIASPADATNRVALGESFVATYTPMSGYYVSSILTNGALYAFTATPGAAVTLNTGALGANVEVTVVAARIRKTAQHPWWENPVVVHVHEPALKASGAFHMAGDGDFVAAGGRADEPASVLDVSTVEDANGGFVVVTNLPAGASKYGAGLSAALNRAIFGRQTGTQSIAVPLEGPRAAYQIINSDDDVCQPVQFAFSANARKAYAVANAARSYVYSFDVLNALSDSGTRLTNLNGMGGFGDKTVCGLAYARVGTSGNELLYVVLNDSSVVIKDLAYPSADAQGLLTAAHSRLALTNASLAVCQAGGAPHLAIASATGTDSALEVFALDENGLNATTTPVLSLDAEHLAAMGLDDTTSSFATSVYGLEGGSAAILGWGGTFYAVKYVAPIEVTFGVTNGTCNRAGETFYAKSWFTDDEKRFVFTATSGNILKKATVNGKPTPFTYGATSFDYVPGNQATQHVEVVFLPPACIPEPVDVAYEGLDANERHVFALPDSSGLTVTVYTNGVALTQGTGYRIEDGKVLVGPFGALDSDVHLVVSATAPRAPVAKKWLEAPMWFNTYLLNPAPGYVGDEDAATETGAEWSLSATQDYLLDIAGGSRGGATLFNFGDLEEKKGKAIWQLAYSDDLFGGGPLGGGAVCKAINVALVGTTNGSYMVSLPLALGEGEVLDNANTFRITAVQADGVTPTNTPVKFAFSSDGTKLFGVSPSFAGVNEYRVVGGLKSAGAQLVYTRNHPFRDAGSIPRSAVAFTYAEVPNAGMYRTDHLAFTTDTDGNLYRVSLEGDNTYTHYATETNGMAIAMLGERLQLAVAGIAATNLHLYVFREPTPSSLPSHTSIILYDIAQPEENYALGGKKTFSVKDVLGWTASNSNSSRYREGGYCAMAVPDDERSFVFAANAEREDRNQARFMVRTVPDWNLSVRVQNGLCKLSPGPDFSMGERTITSGTALPLFTCTDDYFLDAYSIDGVAQPVSIVPPIRSFDVPVSEYNGRPHAISVHFEKRVINLQLVGGVTAEEQPDRSYYVTLPEDLPWELRENGVIVDPLRATNVTASVIHYTPDINQAVINAVFAFYKPRPELEESERWYASGTALKWSHQPTEQGYLGRYEQRHFAGVNWAMDANGSYLLDIAGWRQGGASLYLADNLETGKVETVGGTAGAQWQIDYATQLLADNDYKYAEFNGGVVSKALGVAAIAVHDGSILPTNTEVMLSMPLEIGTNALNNRCVFRITAFKPDENKTFVKTPRSGAFTADGRYLWGVSDGFAGVNKYEVLDGLKSAGQKLKLVRNIPLTADGEGSQTCASMAYAILGGREIAYALGTNCCVYAVNLTDGTVTNTGVKAGSPHDQLAIAGVGKGIPHLYLARVAVTNLVDTGNSLLTLYNVNTNSLALSLKEAYPPNKVADWCGFDDVDYSWSYYTCAIAVPDNEKSLFLTWNFAGEPKRQRRYVIQKTAPVTLSLSCAPGITSFSVATSADPEPTASTSQADMQIRPYTRVSFSSYSVAPGATDNYKMPRVAAQLSTGNASRVTQTNGVWTIGSAASLTLGLGDCSYSADTSAADITLAVTQSSSGAELSEAQKAAVETNVNAAVAAVGGQQAAAWLEGAGWGATLTAADVAAAKDVDVSALLGTEVLVSTGVVATITQAAETTDAQGVPQLSFTFVVEDGAGNGALALKADDVVEVVKNFVRKSATLGAEETWDAPSAEDLDVSLSADKKSATVTVKMGGDGQTSQGFYKLILK